MDYQEPLLRSIAWIGDSLDNIKEFPENVRKLIGDQLQSLQWGKIPKDAKPFKGVGSGVIELAIRHNKEAYRCVQAVQLEEKIYVLHAFHKKSKKGMETPQKDVDLIEKRYKQAQELAKNRGE